MKREEAIETIRRCCPRVGDSQCDFETALRKLIPELRESEDERIRKGLIHLISEQDGILTAINGVSVKDILAYLEKQKDASKAIEVVDRIDKYIDQQVANAHDMEDSNPDKKYYLGWDDALGEISGILKDVYSGENQKEQKPEQYDIDVLEKHITKNSISELAHTVIVRNGWEIVEKEQKPDDDPLDDPKFIKGFDTGREVQRIFDEQKHAEWSEDDDANLNRIIRVLEDNESDWKELSDWLKSLRLDSYKNCNSRWKPSDEQMAALKEASASWMNEKMGNAELLQSLYEQLKAL